MQIFKIFCGSPKFSRGSSRLTTAALKCDWKVLLTKEIFFFCTEAGKVINLIMT